MHYKNILTESVLQKNGPLFSYDLLIIINYKSEEYIIV